MSQQPAGLRSPRPQSQTPAEVFLESLQHRVYASLGMDAEDCQRREWLGQRLVLPARLQQKAQELTASAFAEYRQALFEGLARDEEAPRPTRFERPHQYSILRELKYGIESAVEQLGFELPGSPVIGTLPTRQLDPVMVRVPDTTQTIVVVDGALLTYINLLAKAVARALPLDFAPGEEGPLSAASWNARLARSGAAARFLDLMQAALEGNPAGAAPYLPEPSYEQIATELCDCMELFVIGREYARLIEGEHLRARVELRTAGRHSFSSLVWTEAQQQAADGLGLALMIAAAAEEGTPASLAIWAADLLLASFGILDRAHWLAASPPGVASPAPFPVRYEERRALIRELARHWEFGEEAIRFADDQRPLLDAFESTLEGWLMAERFGTAPVH
jgi:hypothetical protein